MDVATTRVLPAFFELCAKYLCSEAAGAGPDGGGVACLEAIVVPPPEDQAMLLEAMRAIARTTDVDGLQPTFLRLLMHGEVDAARGLLAYVVQYNEAVEMIRNAVEATGYLT